MADRSVVVRLIADTSQYSDQMRNAARGTRDVGGAGEEAQDSLKGLKAVLATVGAGAIVKTGIEFNAMKERAQAAFTTLSGSAKAANSQLVAMQRDFGSSPFGFETIIQAGQRLTAMGVPLGDLNKMLLNISDATAAVGGNSEVFDRISMSLGQMLSKGTVQSEEMLQLAEAGIPAWQLLAKEIGVSVPEAMKRVQNRQVDAKTAVDALMNGIEDRFGGATKNAADTWSGMLARLKAETVQAVGEIVKPLMRIGTEGAEAVRPIISAAGGVGNAFANLPSPIQNTALALGAVALFSGRLNSAWSGLRAGAEGATGGLRNIWVAGNNASSGMQAFGLRAIAAGSAARSAGASMLGAFGGPLGLAITGTVVGLSLYQQKQQEAAAAAAAHDAAVTQLADDLDKQTLALSANARAQLSRSLATDKVNDKSVSDSLRDAGANAFLFRDALANGAKSNAFKNTNADLLQLSTTALQSSDAWKKYGAELKSMGFSLDDVAAASLRGGDQLDSMSRRLAHGADSAAAQKDAGEKLRASLGQLPGLYSYLTDHVKVYAEAQKQQADAMMYNLPDAAAKAGVSVGTLQGAFSSWRSEAESGRATVSNLQNVLRSSGLTAQQAKVAFDILAGGTSNASAGARQMAYDFSAAASAIAQSASGFVNPTSAWDAAVQANTPTGGAASGGAKQAKQPSLSDDPAYRKAKKAADEQRRALRDQKSADRDRIRGARAVAKADADAATAASKRAAATKKAADEAKKASDQARQAVEDAQKQKEQADRNAADAAALAAAIKEQSGRAGTMDQAAWSRAQGSANLAVSSTASTASSAGARLSAASADAAAKARAERATAVEAAKAAAAAKAAKARADESKRMADAVASYIENRQAQSQKRLDALNKAQERAQRRFERRSQNSAASSTGAVAGSYSSMAKNVKVSLSDYLDQLRKQVRAQTQWKNDLLALAAKIPPGMVAELAKLGPQAAPLIRQLATGSKKDLGEFVKLFGKAGTDAGAAVANDLTAAIPLIGAAASTAGSDAATKLATAIKDGRVTVAQAMKSLTKNGVDLTLGLKNKREVEAYINSLSRKSVTLKTTMQITNVKDAKGNVVEKRFGGGNSQIIMKASGGWVTGGSGMKDDVRIPVARDAFDLRAMGGEFMVRRDIAQANKGFFNTLNRTGKIPTAAPQIVAPRIVLPNQAPTRQIVNNFAAGSFVQRDGQSVADMYREFDRLAGMGAGPA